MAKKQTSSRTLGPVPHQAHSQVSSTIRPSSSSSSIPKSKTSGAAKKKNKKKAAQARQLNSNHLDHLTDHVDSIGLADRSDMIGAYPGEETSSNTHRTASSSASPDEDDDRGTSHSMHPSLAAATRQTQEDLLATANDLYRQIETAAAAALASHLSPQSLASIGNNSSSQGSDSKSSPGNFSSQNGNSPHPDDDAYWSSLPSHLRSFIRSALPLAAGHSSSLSQSQSNLQNHSAILPNLSSFASATGMIAPTSNSNSQQTAPQLSSEQMAAAAEQLARVVQSHDWGRAVSTAAQQAGLTHGNAVNGTTRSSSNYSRDGSGGGGATVSVTGGTVTGTIPLGSFTLPLPIHSHSDHSHQHSHGLNIPEPVYYTGETTIVASRASDKSNTDGGPLDDGYYSEVARTTKDEGAPGHMVSSHRLNVLEQASNDSNGAACPSSPITNAVSSKKKKKNKKKKTANTTLNEVDSILSNHGAISERTGSLFSFEPPSKLSPHLTSVPRKTTLDTVASNAVNPISPSLTAPPSRLPPVPPGVNQKKKPLVSNAIPSNVRETNNSASSSTITNITSSNVPHQPTERERIRDFWLTLNQEERANLVKIEKDAVLKKMKEQQRHSCSCAVCGRKRLAIEQELEVLYDAYYDELENYAEASKRYYGSDTVNRGGKALPGMYPKPPGPGPFPGSVDVMTTTAQPPSQTAKKTVPKPSRDHKNIRPRPQQAALQQPHPPQPTIANNRNHYPQLTNAVKRTLPLPSQPKKNISHNGSSDHDHVHSPSCPHHPHHHDSNHYHPSSNGNRGKGVANHSCGAQAIHPRNQHSRADDDIFPDEDPEEDDDDEYNDDDEEEYDEDDDEDGEFEDDDEIPALEEVPSEAPEQINPPRKVNAKGIETPYNSNKMVNGVKGTANSANNGDLFGFGNSLTVKGGILTVADDLLRNDGQKFLEMMESLADKHDEEGEEYDDDEEDDELDDDEGFEDEIVTEEYRMKEGRRMFQIFAARMFEQRVLTAYRERVAQEKQAQLLRELEDEDRLAQEREMKKVKDAQKKKEKKKAQKQLKDQDLAKKMKDKEQEELAAKAAEEARLEAEKRKQEEQRQKREAQRKLQEAERARKEEEKRKRLEDEARRRKEKEEKAKLEKEARAVREKEERERRAKEEAQRKMKAEAERKEKEAREAKIRDEAQRKKQAEIDKREAEGLAKREAAKAAAAKISAQTKNGFSVAPISAALSSGTLQQRSPAAVRHASLSKPAITPVKAPPPSISTFPRPTPVYTPHTPSRQVQPLNLPRQLSVGIGLGRPSSAAAAPPFSTGVSPMGVPTSYSTIPPRPPSAQYGSNFHTPSGPPPSTPADISIMSNIQTSIVSGPYLPMGGFQPPMGPMMHPINNRAFSGTGIPSAPQTNFINQHQSLQQSQKHRTNLVSAVPPSTPTHPPGILSPTLGSATSPLSALHLGSEPVRKASASAAGPIGPSSHLRRPSGIDETLFQTGFFSNSIEPIGRPKVHNSAIPVDPLGNNSDHDSTSISTGGPSPTRSPQNALGSSALLADDYSNASFPRRHTMPTNIPPSSAASSLHASAFENGLGVGSSIWGSSLPSGGDTGWGSSVLPNHHTVPVAPRTPLQQSLQINTLDGAGALAGTRESTTDWIRRRAISAYCNMRLDEKWIPVGDVSIEMQRIHSDTLHISLKEMVDACLVKRNIHNGGGDWQFSQQGPVLYTRWVPVSSQEAAAGVPAS
ncbi:hypothetical protein BY996DRAFT_4587717 [Phakopsora pachyrhizi]|uniref:Stress response protein NST1 n=1 Tax=Phakopsora pachyrhizi TaxID=170000 RepID=A0AAV0BAV4_PHAPC|nr:hypothetical protein BY996DRAFT_4587717 [Phakopsora pachyrhizi]CAH7684202.1 hypothetical protein PPACK8108_LOCUS18259 [Phakopsora pachyrhizi]